MVDNCVFSACDTTYILDTIYYGQRYTENGFDIVCNQNTLIGLNVYEQTLQNEDGCDSLVYLILNILCPEKKRANTITPSVQDGLNDVFMPFGEEMNPYSTVYIYNRWGKLVHKENVTTPVYWDGKVNGQVSSGTFYYVIEMSNGCAYHGTLTVM